MFYDRRCIFSSIKLTSDHADANSEFW